MQFQRTAFIIFAFLISPFAAAGDNPSFLGLQNLVGTWKIVKPQSEWEEKFRLTYRFISKDSALVEVYGDPQRQTTETIYHANGNTLMATHYCARGNQPRLKAIESSDAKIVAFDFMDVTNLVHNNDPHMVGMRFIFIDKDHFEKEETYHVNGKAEVSSFSLVREQ